MAYTFKSDLNKEEINLLAGSFINPNHPDYKQVKESIASCDARVRSCVDNPSPPT